MVDLTDELESDIIFGVFPPGSRIVEDRIMARFSAKRHVVRRAFSELETRGLLVRHPNRGVEVVEFTPDEVDALYDIRIVLEMAAAERTNLPCDDATVASIGDVARRHADAVERQDWRSVYDLNLQFHRQQYACCTNPKLAELIEKYARSAQPIRVVKYDDRDHMKVVVEQHFAIVEALGGTSSREYVRVTREHLPASAKAYRELFERRFAGRVRSG